MVAIVRTGSTWRPEHTTLCGSPCVWQRSKFMGHHLPGCEWAGRWMGTRDGTWAHYSDMECKRPKWWFNPLCHRALNPHSRIHLGYIFANLSLNFLLYSFVPTVIWLLNNYSEILSSWWKTEKYRKPIEENPIISFHRNNSVWHFLFSVSYASDSFLLSVMIDPSLLQRTGLQPLSSHRPHTVHEFSEIMYQRLCRYVLLPS